MNGDTANAAEFLAWLFSTLDANQREGIKRHIMASYDVDAPGGMTKKLARMFVESWVNNYIDRIGK